MAIVFLIFIFVLSFVGTFILKRVAIHRNILDFPNTRSSHTQPTPRGGGLAIAIIWFLVIIFLFLKKEIDSTLFFALLCGLPISAVGLVDDIITISPKVRLFVQVASATIALFFLGGINSIDIGFRLLSVPFLVNVVVIIGIVWFINLFNFLDGIDGYISSEVIFIGTAIFILQGTVAPLLLAAIVSGFLIWNWQPAKIFMGDVGSTLLGFTIGVFMVYYNNVGESSIVTWLILTSLFWFDASLTLFRRWRKGEKLSLAHKKHAYQRIVQSGFSHQKTVLHSILINVILLGLAYLSIFFNKYQIIFLLVAILFLYIVVRLIDKKFPFVYSKEDNLNK